ncbi:hypothetical protein AB1Y20_002077 [Prymnesium parvum]|uniref:Acid phosphatase n=1 Tax=Prymnesium parvum TaxID=97485 RepID=A0AB34J7G7_PRYPA
MAEVSARVAVVHSIAALPESCEEGDTVFVDIDETLLVPEPDASEAWARQLAAQLGGGSGWPAACHLWAALQGVCEARACEARATRDALDALRRRGLRVHGLTSRDCRVAEETFRQLAACGLDGIFEQKTLGELARGEGGGAPIWHERGVVYCAGSRKAEGVESFERRGGGGRHGRVVLIDDRLQHVQAVCEALERQGRGFLGLHYVREGADAHGDYALPHSVKLLARALATRRGRAHVLAALDALEGEPARHAHAMPSRRHSLMVASVSFLVGVTVGATALIARGVRRS